MTIHPIYDPETAAALTEEGWWTREDRELAMERLMSLRRCTVEGGTMRVSGGTPRRDGSTEVNGAGEWVRWRDVLDACGMIDVFTDDL